MFFHISDKSRTKKGSAQMHEQGELNGYAIIYRVTRNNAGILKPKYDENVRFIVGLNEAMILLYMRRSMSPEWDHIYWENVDSGIIVFFLPQSTDKPNTLIFHQLYSQHHKYVNNQLLLEYPDELSVWSPNYEHSLLMGISSIDRELAANTQFLLMCSWVKPNDKNWIAGTIIPPHHKG
ncbi:hypothetical protein HUJ04_007459 [Dendroctonus ponderosae]|nr:hypothetical protein HUJ04_007459 [Dendroctonus ponderosae]